VQLDDLLKVGPVADGRYESVPDGEGFLFGGLTFAVGLRAAAETVRPGMTPKAIRANFVRPGQWGGRTELEVEPVIDGRTIAARQVTATQAGKILSVMTASFHVAGSGIDWQAPMPFDVPPPEDLAPSPVTLPVLGLIEVRPVVPHPDVPMVAPIHPYWARPGRPVSDSPIVHNCVIAFLSDYLVTLSALKADPNLSQPSGTRTLDHGLWFHRAVDANDWLLFTADPVSMTDGRCVLRGTVRTRDGVLAASFTQEVIVAG
jgi:acyl-CoA thioesterase-2